MALRRKLRKFGSSFVVTIPSDIANVFNWADGDIVEFEIFIEEETNERSIIMKKVDE